MQTKISPEQFDEIVRLSYPSYMIKMTHICLDKCHIDLTMEDHGPSQTNTEVSQELDSQKKKISQEPKVQPQARKPDQLLYLSDREALCIESCSKMYIRQTNKMVDIFKDKLTF